MQHCDHVNLIELNLYNLCYFAVVFTVVLFKRQPNETVHLSKLKTDLFRFNQ